MAKKKVPEKKITTVNTIKKQLKEVLTNQGSYTEGIGTLIETTAGSIYAYNLALRDVENLKESFVEEITREGNVKLTPHPAIKVMREQAEMVRKLLRELRLTIETAEGIGDDDMDKMMNRINNLEDE